MWGFEKIAWHEHPRSRSPGVPPKVINSFQVSSLIAWDLERLYWAFIDKLSEMSEILEQRQSDALALK